GGTMGAPPRVHSRLPSQRARTPSSFSLTRKASTASPPRQVEASIGAGAGAVVGGTAGSTEAGSRQSRASSRKRMGTRVAGEGHSFVPGLARWNRPKDRKSVVEARRQDAG